ncbi:hypothetical protein PM082_002477 [Marasmius tenuissimus]|nr:hypothetical protein PM082_002477 [Marasmius tenuissimus]
MSTGVRFSVELPKPPPNRARNGLAYPSVAQSRHIPDRSSEDLCWKFKTLSDAGSALDVSRAGTSSQIPAASVSHDLYHWVHLQTCPDPRLRPQYAIQRRQTSIKTFPKPYERGTCPVLTSDALVKSFFQSDSNGDFLLLLFVFVVFGFRGLKDNYASDIESLQPQESLIRAINVP